MVGADGCTLSIVHERIDACRINPCVARYKTHRDNLPEQVVLYRFCSWIGGIGRPVPMPGSSKNLNALLVLHTLNQPNGFASDPKRR